MLCGSVAAAAHALRQVFGFVVDEANAELGQPQQNFQHLVPHDDGGKALPERQRQAGGLETVLQGAGQAAQRQDGIKRHRRRRVLGRRLNGEQQWVAGQQLATENAFFGWAVNNIHRLPPSIINSSPA